MVVKGPGAILLGRDWLQLNWNTVFHVQVVSPQLQRILDKNKVVFVEGLGMLKGIEAKISADPGATPKFLKARPVPYALKAKVEQELERLQKEGIMSAVDFTEWAAPIVSVVKQDGSVRICGDYKCTVNQVSSLDNYRIPKTEDLPAGGYKLTNNWHTSNCGWMRILRSILPSKRTRASTSTTNCFLEFPLPRNFPAHHGKLTAGHSSCDCLL